MVELIAKLLSWHNRFFRAFVLNKINIWEIFILSFCCSQTLNLALHFTVFISSLQHHQQKGVRLLQTFHRRDVAVKIMATACTKLSMCDFRIFCLILSLASISLAYSVRSKSLYLVVKTRNPRLTEMF